MNAHATTNAQVFVHSFFSVLLSRSFDEDKRAMERNWPKIHLLQRKALKANMPGADYHSSSSHSSSSPSSHSSSSSKNTIDFSPHKRGCKCYLAMPWFKRYYSSDDVEKRHSARFRRVLLCPFSSPSTQAVAFEQIKMDKFFAHPLSCGDDVRRRLGASGRVR